MPLPLVIIGLVVVTAVGLLAARIMRERHDAAHSAGASGGWDVTSQLPITLGAPFNQFSELLFSQPYDVMQGTDEGFEVVYFEVTIGRNPPVPRAGAIVVLPTDAPVFEMSEGDPVPPAVGPRTAEELRYLAGVMVRTTGSALFVRSISVPARTVQRTALQLAKAIVSDGAAAQSTEMTSAS